MSHPLNEHPQQQQQQQQRQYESHARDNHRPAEYVAPTPDAHIHSSIPLGIALPSNASSSSLSGEAADGLVPTTIIWHGGGRIVKLAGTFESSWRGRIGMIQE